MPRLLPSLRRHARALAALATAALLFGPMFGAARATPRPDFAIGDFAIGGSTIIVCTAEGPVARHVGGEGAPATPGSGGHHCMACLGRDIASLPPAPAELPAAPASIRLPGAVAATPTAPRPSHLRPTARAPPSLA